MKIHTFKKGEKICDIAKSYGICEECLISSNLKGCENAAAGEELLVLTPTRTYVLKKGDTPERLALRFGVQTKDILAQNPRLLSEGATPGKTVTLKQDVRMYGTAPTNGYFYKGCDMKRLECALPYLTYITVGAAVAERDEIRFDFNDGDLLKMLYEHSKIPLLRIYDNSVKRDFSSKEKISAFVAKIINAAISHNYQGVVLSSETAGGDFKNFGEFLLELRRAMIGCDLILILEIDENTPTEIAELADGNVLFYPKFALSPETSFEDGERRIFSDFAVNCESAKTFIDICALAKHDNGFITTEDALKRARECGAEISTGEKSLISEFTDKKSGKCTFTSLSNIKCIYDIIEEFGFMGASFDIGRTPITHLLMYNMCFKTAVHTYSRAKEGCSRG